MEPLFRGQNQIGPHSIRFYVHRVQTHVLTWVAHSIEWSKYHLTLFFFFATKYKTSTANLPTKATIKLSRHDIYWLVCKSCPTWVLFHSKSTRLTFLGFAVLPPPPGNEFPQRNNLLESPLQLAPPSKTYWAKSLEKSWEVKFREDKTRERNRDVHAHDMARGLVVEGAVTCHRALEAFPSIQNAPIPFSAARIYPKVPVFLPQFLPYLSQYPHCAKPNKRTQTKNQIIRTKKLII